MRYFILAILSVLFAGVSHAQKVYSTNHQYEADIKVYVVEHDYQADLIVFKTDKEYRAKSNENKGIWFFTDRSYKADKKIFFVDHEYQADIKVYFTDKEYRAGWKNNSRKHLLYWLLRNGAIIRHNTVIELKTEVFPNGANKRSVAFGSMNKKM